MATYQQQKQQVLQLFQQGIAIAKNLGNSELEKHLQEAQKHLAEGKLYVVVCGEFKQGKSSLINAFLEETNLFPVDVDITTNLVSTINYSPEEKITVIVGDIGQGKAKQISREEISEYVTEQLNQGNSKNAKLLMIEAPNPHLKEGLVLVDTPGIGSLNTEHTALTYSFIPNADAIIFVSDAFAPLKTEELNFLQERIIPHCPHLIFVVTKIDAIPNSQEVIISNREKLAKILDCSPDEVSLIAVSSRAKQDYLKFKDPEDLECSHFSELQDRVWQLVKEQRGHILLLKALTDLAKALTQLKRPMEVEWEAYQEHSQEELATLEQQLKTTQQQLQDLLRNNADWQTCLKDGLDDIKSQIQEQFQTNFVQLQRQATKYLEDSRLLENPQQIPTLLEADLDGLMTDLSKNLNAKAGDLYTQLEEQSGLNFNPFQLNSLERKKANFAVDQIEIKKSSAVDKALTVGRNGMFNTGAGAFVGGVVGAIIGGGFAFFTTAGIGTVAGAQIGAQIGSGLGTLAGGTKGVIEGIKNISQQDRVLAKQEIGKILKQYLEDSQRLCLQTLTKSVKALERFMRDELSSQIKRQKDSYDLSLKSLKQACQSSQAQVSQRIAQLKSSLQQLTQLQQQVEQIAIASAASAKSPPRQTEPQQVSTSSKDPLQPVVAGVDGDYGDWADE